MFVDITLKVTKDMIEKATGNQKIALSGHLGTHFDVMNKEFPLSYVERKGIVFDISGVKDREVEVCDIDLNKVEKDMFVAFYSGYIERIGYGTKQYYSGHPQLSDELITALVEKGISLIGIDFAGVQRHERHTPKDQYCADHGTFVIENLCNLKKVLDMGGVFVANTYPVNYEGMSGLPCRVIAKV